MEYGRLEMLESEPGNETPEVTMRAIRKILDESRKQDQMEATSAPAPASAPALQDASRSACPVPPRRDDITRHIAPIRDVAPPSLVARLAARLFARC